MLPVGNGLRNRCERPDYLPQPGQYSYEVDFGTSDEATQREVVKAAEALHNFRGDKGIVVPQKTHLIRATPLDSPFDD